MTTKIYSPRFMADIIVDDKENGFDYRSVICVTDYDLNNLKKRVNHYLTVANCSLLRSYKVRYYILTRIYK